MSDETLAQLVRTRLDELGLGVREAARPYEPVLTKGDISDFQLGKRVDISGPKVQALALALKVPVRRVRAAIDYTLTSKPLELPGRLNLLTPSSRKVLVDLGEALLRIEAKHEASPPASDDTRPVKPAGRTPRRKGVRKVGS